MPAPDAAGAGLHREFQRIENVGVQRPGGVHAHRARRRALSDQHPVVRIGRVVKRTVLNHLRVNTALAGKVDFLKKNAEEIGTDDRAGLIRLNRQRGGRLRLDNRRPGHQEDVIDIKGRDGKSVVVPDPNAVKVRLIGHANG